MRPRFALNDASNGGGSYSESFSYSTFRKCASGKQIPNLDCLLLIYLCHWMKYSLERWSYFSATKIGRFQIVRSGPKFQMTGITTRWIVAIVEHVKTAIKISESKEVSESVSFPSSSFVGELSVPKVSPKSNPWPAFFKITLFNPSPKAFGYFQWVVNFCVVASESCLPSEFFCDKSFDVHNSLPACATTRRAFSF